MATIVQVARQAGVAPSTVSYVLSRKRSISEETRQRVQEAIAALGYQPDARARSLASQRSHILALVMPLRGDMYFPVMMQIATAVCTEARAFGHDVLLMTKDEGVAGLRRVAGSGLADAMILTDIELRDERLTALAETDTPAVLMGLPAVPSGRACVDLDFEAAGAACVDHLADLGHRQIVLIGEGEEVHRRHTGYAAHTLAGFQRRARERGLRALHRSCEGGYESTAAVLSRILADRPGTSGFVVQNEPAVPALLSLLNLAGRSVPKDASVVAVCIDELALQSSPRLTSVSIPAEEMGRHAVRLAVARLEGRPAPSLVLLAPQLTIRDSSAPGPFV